MLVARSASAVQKGLWFIEQLHPGRASYNNLSVFELRGEVHWDLLQQALDQIVARHESLRTSFGTQGGQPIQVIHTKARVLIARSDVEPGDGVLTRALRQAEAEGAVPFDLTTAPLLRVRSFTIDTAHHLLVFTAHHIVSDGWSQVVVFEELGAAYTALVAGQAVTLEPVAIQYADFVLWQEKQLTPALREQQLGYWRQALANLPDPLDLAVDRRRPQTPSGRGGIERAVIDAELTAAIHQLCQSRNATVFMVFTAGLKILLQRYTGQSDLVIGAPAAVRPRPELERTVGFFANSLAIRTDLSGAPSFGVALDRVKASALGAFEHQDVPFYEVVRAVRPDRRVAQTPLFQVMCGAQRLPDGCFTLPGIEVTSHYLSNGTSKFDLLLDVQEHSTTIETALEYNADIFDPDTCRRWLAALTSLLSAACAEPDRSIAKLPVISPPERLMIEALNQPASEPALDVTVVSLFEKRAQELARRPAVTFGTETLSFGQLDAESNRLARLLIRGGVERGDRVGLCLERSLDVAVAILGVLKAGAAYVPMDVSYPAERLRFMAEDAGLALVLASSPAAIDALGPELADRLRADWRTAMASEATTSPGVLVRAIDACYVMYTSGSTGRPKGVVMPHGPLVNLVRWQLERSAEKLTTMQFGALSFDVSFQEFFATWLSGGRLVIASDSARRDPRELLTLLRHERVERLFLPFVALQLLAEVATASGTLPERLREVITAGEQLRTTPALRGLFDALKGATLDNQYGPTEAHVVTAHLLEGDPATWPELPSIGRPIANARIHLLDASQERVPVGITGELWIGGACLADGYWQRPDLTTDAFRTIEIDGRPERLYRSGDSARYRPDGTIEFLGRRDHQVKIRGFRVEPGEIESVLASCPGIQQVAVVARPHAAGLRLVAYFVAATPTVREADVREFARVHLPDHLLPSTYVALGTLPLTPSGKLDRAALPAPDQVARKSDVTALPETVTERKLADIWMETLGLPSIGRSESFFDVGGHSLAALRLFAKIEATMGVSLPLATLIELPTIAELAFAIDDAVRAPEKPRWSMVVSIKEGSTPPLICVHSLSGDVLEYRTIAMHLPREQRVIGLQAVLGDGVDQMYGSLEATAQAYLSGVKQVQPRGPYFLCGWSSGGTLAFEMAQQLLAGGETVALLAVIDSTPNNVTVRIQQPAIIKLGRQIANIPAWVRDDLFETSLAQVWARARHKIGVTLRRWRRPAGSEGVRDVVDFPRRSEQWEHFAETHYKAFRKYVPGPCGGRVSVFTAPTHPLTRLSDSQSIWRQLARDVDVYKASGTHFSIVKEPNVQVLAARLDQAIAKANRSLE